jgi:hypothetical protein
LGTDSGSVKASTFFRNLNRDVPNPVVGDSTENADIAPDTYDGEGFSFSGDGRDWKISQMRGSIKSYTINQTDSATYDKNVDGDNLEWNSNLDKTIPKYYNIQGNIHAVTDLQPPTTEPDNALKFVSNMITNLNIEVSGSVLGSGGKGGYYLDKFNLGNRRGEPGGHAIKLNSDDGKGIVVSVTNTGKIYGGGGGGGQGGTGSKGPDGVYFIPRVIGGTLTNGLGEWYTYSQGGGCGVSDSGCGDSTNDIWHWSVDEDNYSISDGGTGYQVGDIVTINDARKSDGATGNTVNATAEVTSVLSSVGVEFASNGDIIATGNGTRQVVIRMAWHDNPGSDGLSFGRYQVPSLGIDFLQGIRSFDRGDFDDNDAAAWHYPNGQYLIWQDGTNYDFGYYNFTSAGEQQVPPYSAQQYKDGNGNPNERAPWTQIITVTGGQTYPCILTKAQDVPGREDPPPNGNNFYPWANNNVSYSQWFWRSNNNKRLCFNDPHQGGGNLAACMVWLDEVKSLDGDGNPVRNEGNSTEYYVSNRNGNAADFDSNLPSVGQSFVTGIKILTGGKRYEKSQYDQTIQTTSGGSGSGLKIYIRTNRGWLRDASNTKHETRSYNGDTLKVTNGTYASNQQGGGCDRKCWWNFGIKAFCRHTNRNYGPAYCIIEDPAIGVGALGGAGGFGGQGRGSNGAGNALIPRTDGVDGADGDVAAPPTTTTDGGDGGNGGNGGDWAIAGGDGQDGQCNIVCVNPEDGFDGGVAGRAIFGTNYTVNDGNFNSNRVKGEYQPSQ